MRRDGADRVSGHRRHHCHVLYTRNTFIDRADLEQPLLIQQSLHGLRLRRVALAFDGFSIAQS